MATKKDESSQKTPSKKEDTSLGSQKIPSKKEESTQGNQGDVAGAPGQLKPLHSLSASSVLKSGPLFLSCKGIGWTSWKKRWFVLTPTSLVFYRSDPAAVSQKGSEVNLTLGGIDLNNSGSVVVKADKKLITVSFPDGRDGRAFTLKAETSEDLNDWKAALETALSQAPSSASATGQNGAVGNDQTDADDGSKEPEDDQQPIKSAILQTPILHALENADGTPTFLEKALRFVEERGGGVEGILRQAADVEHVMHRIREYEQGKTEFSSEDDPHVIGDCVKYVLREMPSSPIPASCCKALLEASKTERGGRVNAVRVAIMDTFPEPNRRLLQRILIMMQIVASHKAKNLMSPSAVAACMAPLLLRPLLAGECDIENDFDVGEQGSLQLLQAAAAANHAQAIVMTLMEAYDKIFGEGSVSPGLYSDSEESGSGEATEDDESYEEEESDDDESCEDDEYDDASVVSELDNDNNVDSAYSTSVSDSSEADDDLKATKKSSSSPHDLLPKNVGSNRSLDKWSNNTSTKERFKFAEPSKDVSGEANMEDNQSSAKPFSYNPKSTSIGRPGQVGVRTQWGRTAAKKNLSMESIDFPCEVEDDIDILKAEKADLQNRLTEEVNGNAILEASLEERKKSLQERRQALEKDVARLEKELQKEKDKRVALEAGLNPSQGPVCIPPTVDEKIKADLKDIAQAEADIIVLNKKVDVLGMQLNKHLAQNAAVSEAGSHNKNQPNHRTKTRDKLRGAELSLTKSKSKGNKSSSQGLFGLTASDKATADSATQKSLASSKSRKSAGKSEAANSTSSALTRLTSRLNFLKDRRTQISYDIEDTENAHGDPSSDKGKEPESAVNPEKGREKDNTK